MSVQINFIAAVSRSALVPRPISNDLSFDGVSTTDDFATDWITAVNHLTFDWVAAIDHLTFDWKRVANDFTANNSAADRAANNVSGQVRVGHDGSL